jgi:hypothetical protein
MDLRSDFTTSCCIQFLWNMITACDLCRFIRVLNDPSVSEGSLFYIGYYYYYLLQLGFHPVAVILH